MIAAHGNPDLDALVSAIESLQERIRRDHETIGSNEIRTRTALVDPLLNALGWDTADPAMVIPEYAAGGGAADYALLKVMPGSASALLRTASGRSRWPGAATRPRSPTSPTKRR